MSRRNKNHKQKGSGTYAADLPDMLPGEGLIAYRDRTGLSADDVLREVAAKSNYNRVDAPADYAARENAASNSYSPEEQQAVKHAFLGELGNEIGYRVAKQAKSYVDTASNVLQPVLDKTAPVAGQAFGVAKKITDGIYNMLGIPDDLSNEASGARVAAATTAARIASEGKGIEDIEDEIDGEGIDIKIKRDGLLKAYGYSSKEPVDKRRGALKKALKRFDASDLWRKLNAVAVLQKNRAPENSKVFREDCDWLETLSKIDKARPKKDKAASTAGAGVIADKVGFDALSVTPEQLDILKSLHEKGLPQEDIQRMARQFIHADIDGDGIADWISNIFFGGRKGGQKAIDQLLAEHGKAIIKEISVWRVPVKATVLAGANLIAGGKLDEARKKLNYDTLFHLSANIVLSDGYAFQIEKNEVVKIIPNPKIVVENCGGSMGVPGVEAKQIPLAVFINNAVQKMGSSFYEYSALHHNCQEFIGMLLQANGLLNSELTQFIVQDVQSIARHLPPGTSDVMNAITSLAAAWAQITGKGATNLKGKGFNPETSVNEDSAKRHYKSVNDMIDHLQEPFKSKVNGLKEVDRDMWATELFDANKRFDEGKSIADVMDVFRRLADHYMRDKHKYSSWTTENRPSPLNDNSLDRETFLKHNAHKRWNGQT